MAKKLKVQYLRTLKSLKWLEGELGAEASNPNSIVLFNDKGRLVPSDTIWCLMPVRADVLASREPLLVAAAANGYAVYDMGGNPPYSLTAVIG